VNFPRDIVHMRFETPALPWTVLESKRWDLLLLYTVYICGKANEENKAILAWKYFSTRLWEHNIQSLAVLHDFKTDSCVFLMNISLFFSLSIYWNFMLTNEFSVAKLRENYFVKIVRIIHISSWSVWHISCLIISWKMWKFS
jgi:hypothetical protein